MEELKKVRYKFTNIIDFFISNLENYLFSKKPGLILTSQKQ